MENKNNNVKSNIWMILASFAIGVVIGFILSPVKKGAIIGCHNGNNYNSDIDDDFFDDDEYDEYYDEEADCYSF